MVFTFFSSHVPYAPDPPSSPSHVPYAPPVPPFSPGSSGPNSPNFSTPFPRSPPRRGDFNRSGPAYSDRRFSPISAEFNLDEEKTPDDFQDLPPAKFPRKSPTQNMTEGADDEERHQQRTDDVSRPEVRFTLPGAKLVSGSAGSS